MSRVRSRQARQIQGQRLERARDFPAWFTAVGELMYRATGRRTTPMPAREIDRLRLPRHRSGRGRLPLPPGLRTILAFDRDLVARGDRREPKEWWDSNPQLQQWMRSLG